MRCSNTFVPQFTEKDYENVLEKISPNDSRACNNNLLLSSNNKSYSGNYYGFSLKRTNIKKCIFDKAQLDHTTLAGSILSEIKFLGNCKFDSVYLEQSIISSSLFASNLHINGCNFSHSYLDDCTFNDVEFRSTYFNNSYLNNCKFKNCVIRSTMFDSAVLSNCDFSNCNMKNLNLEFATFYKCNLFNTSFSFFQLPYIIGIFDNNISTINISRSNCPQMSFDEYKNQIDDSIKYFTYLQEYFPLASLYYAIGNNEIAINCIKVGIQKSLQIQDIRMVDNFCKLGQFYNLLTINDIKEILEQVDSVINNLKDSPIFSILLSKSYQLRSSVASNESKAKFEVIINTNINGTEFEKASDFCQDIDNIILSILPGKVVTSYQISHNSPFQICLTCIGLVADVIQISTFIYDYLQKRTRKNSDKHNVLIENYIKKSNEMFINDVNNQFDLLKELLRKSEKEEQDKIVENFRGKIISSLSNQIDKDFALVISGIDDK